MKIEIAVPAMGESVAEGVIGQIFCASGSFVEKEAELLEIETDKVNQVLYAPQKGRLQLSVQTGQTVQIGQVIGSIETDSAAPDLPPLDPPPVSKEATVPPASTAPKETRKRLSSLRRTIAKRLVEVKNETAMLTTFNELDMSAVMAVRKERQEAFQKAHGVKLGLMSFFVRACVRALQTHPDLNARIEGDEIVYPEAYHIGIAVGTDQGVLVPVLKNAQDLSYAQIEQQIQAFASQVRGNTLSLDVLKGGTFTISNGGVYGSMLSTPILNPPQSGILGMHNIVKRAVVIDDQIVIRPMMYLALSYDHRVVDGKGAIGFLNQIKETLENREALLQEVQ